MLAGKYKINKTCGDDVYGQNRLNKAPHPLRLREDIAEWSVSHMLHHSFPVSASCFDASTFMHPLTLNLFRRLNPWLF